MKNNDVKFKELKNYNDSNSAVLMAVTFPEEYDFNELNDLLSQEIGFSKGKNLIGVHHICDNVLGKDGRTDWLLEFNNEDIDFNYMVHLRYATTLKWTSDFIHNYKKDYKH